ncbi:MAG: HEAT repeat domain-containing protein [Polyangiaceae bacterium]|nr:HEAT repeat domain-containing protein [Polyangiaceae bacterium]
MIRPAFPLSDGERRRAEEVDRLSAMGHAGVPELLEMLADPSWTVRRGVIASLASLGDAAVGPLCDVLRHRRDNESRIAAAVDALVASVGDVDSEVLALSSWPDPAVVADAAQILGRRRTSAAAARLAELAAHNDDNVAVAAIEALGRIGGRGVVDALVRAVTTDKFFRTFPAIDVLGRSRDPRAVGPLANLLEDPRYMLEAAQALGCTGSRSAVAPLVRLISQPGDAIVRVAARALATLRERHEELYGVTLPIDDAIRRAAPMPVTVRRLVQSLRDASEADQVALSAVLGAMGCDISVGALTGLLDHAPPVANAAADALLRTTQGTQARIFDALRDGDSPRRLLLLPLVTSKSAAPEVIQCTRDADPEVRAAACDALGRTSDFRALDALFPLLADTNGRVVHAAISAIQALGGPRAEQLALAAAESQVPEVRRAALRILGYFGFEAALPVFLERLRDPDARVRELAVAGLPFVDNPRALEALLEVTRAQDARSRAAAVRALGQATPEPRVLDRLVEALDDTDAWVRYYACKSLGRMGHVEAAARIAERLGDEAGQVRVGAVEALSLLKSDIALQTLQTATQEADPDVQRAALIGLGLAGQAESIPYLTAAMASPDAATRLVATSALAGFSGPRVLQALSCAVGDEDENVAAAALGILAAIPGVEATRALVGWLGGPRHERVFLALATPVPGRVEGLVEALETADDERSAHLATALARMRKEYASAALVAALGSRNAAARKAVATALAAVGMREAFPMLEQASALDPDPEVRRVCSLVVAQWAA